MSMTNKSHFVALSVFLIVGCSSGGGGVSANAASQTIDPNATVINGIQVPVDPGPAADATLLGIDTNNNGVRDEVERRIAQDYGKNPQHFDAVMRASKGDQSYLIVNGDPALATAATISNAISGACMYDLFDGDGIASSKASRHSFAITVNTLERIRAYQATTMASQEVSHKVPKNPCQ